MTSERKPLKEKEVISLFDGRFKDIRLQLTDQLQCLDGRLEVNKSLLLELQDYYRRRAEVELDYSRNLDKLAKSINIRHKQEKQKRETWPLYSLHEMWTTLVHNTKRASRDHGVIGDIYMNMMVSDLSILVDDTQRLYKKIRDVTSENQDELIKVLTELQNAMKSYQFYHAESLTAEAKYQEIELQREKILETSSTTKGSSVPKKLKNIEKHLSKRQARYTEQKVKSLQARNDYLLALDTANAAIHRFYCEDLHNLINCMDCGYHSNLKRFFMIDKSAMESLLQSQVQTVDHITAGIKNLDQRADKQRFLEQTFQAFSLPKKFEYHPHKGDQVCQVSAQKSVQDDLVQRRNAAQDRINQLKLQIDEEGKTIETLEKSFLGAINEKEYDVSGMFAEDQKLPRSPRDIKDKKRTERLEMENYYVKKVDEFTTTSNLIARLQAKLNAIQKALGTGDGEQHQKAPVRPPSLPPKPRNSRRLGKSPIEGRPKLFGGSIEEYVEATGEDIPLIVRSCIRVINLFGRHHMGVFRVSGSQHEINEFKSFFERGDDPLIDSLAARDINSVAGVLKLYFRELKEPLFPTHLFDELTATSKLQKPGEFVTRMKELVNSLPRATYVVMRYLFAFLSHLSESCDENMMDLHNLSICFGPTLLPVPRDRDQDVIYHNHVIEVVKNIIQHQDDIFSKDVEGTQYERIEFLVEEDEDVQDSIDNLSDEDLDEVDTSEDGASVNMYRRSNSREHATPVTGTPQSDLSEPPKFTVTPISTPTEPDLSTDAIAQFDFKGRTDRELTFSKGDSISNVEKISSDWWKGTLKGQRGLVPDKYITLQKSSAVDGSATKRLSDTPSRPTLLGVFDMSVSQPSISGTMPSPVKAAEPLKPSPLTSSSSGSIKSMSWLSTGVATETPPLRAGSLGKEQASLGLTGLQKKPITGSLEKLSVLQMKQNLSSNRLDASSKDKLSKSHDTLNDTRSSDEKVQEMIKDKEPEEMSAELEVAEDIVWISVETDFEKDQKQNESRGRETWTQDADDIESIDSALAKIMSGVKELQTSADQPQLPVVTMSTTYQSQGEAPDLVMGLPIGEKGGDSPPATHQPATSSPEHQGGKALSTAEVFASSGQSTIKKGMTSSSFQPVDKSVTSAKTKTVLPHQLLAGAGVHRSATLQAKPSGSRVEQLENVHEIAHRSPSLGSESPIQSSDITKPRPPVARKPTVVKKPTSTDATGRNT